ncbi:MAG: type II toxin-antitoxin system mRNA interferase toxin, RelE/StbE family [Deltaproteobacteria bacterium]|nr:type II toxin-antitoxin system mRNA interferase toxin, RelE/StbE family [Deltaproteobacteria bacterium]
MSKYKIVFAPTAEKQFMRLTRSVRIRVAQAIAKLSDDPFLGKQLKGELKEYRSFRAGDWRIVYFIRRHLIQVESIRVAHRREVYRR